MSKFKRFAESNVRVCKQILLCENAIIIFFLFCRLNKIFTRSYVSDSRCT